MKSIDDTQINIQRSACSREGLPQQIGLRGAVNDVTSYWRAGAHCWREMTRVLNVNGRSWMNLVWR